MKETSISLFKGYSDTHPQDSTLQEIVNLIRNDALVRDRTEKHRYYSHNGQKAAAAWEKAACPCFAVAVCFGGGKQAENITGWTSLALADIDHIDADRLPELIGRVRADKHTLLSYTTISGTGLRIIYRTDCLTAGEEPESLFQNLRAGQPLLCRPAGIRMRPEMQEYHEAQRTGTRPRRLLQSRCRRHAR